MKDWDITHHPSSAYFPHANSRAETAVKSSKRMLQDCVSRSERIDKDKFMKAELQYRNTPHQDCRRSPAQMVFGRPLSDHISCIPYAADWFISQKLRKRMMAKSREVDGEKLARNTKNLRVLQIRDSSCATEREIPNQVG